MSTNLTEQTVTLSQQRRTWRINIETALNTDYLLTAHRELISRIGDTVLAKEPQRPVNRRFSEVASQEVTLQSGKTVTPAEIAEALVAFIERWEVEDV